MTHAERLNSRARTKIRQILLAHRKQLVLGLCVVVVNRLSSLVLPGSSKWLLDEIVAKGQWNALHALVRVAAAGVVLQTVTAFMAPLVIGVAVERMVSDLRRAGEMHVMQLPVSCFDRTMSGALASRVMTDPEAIRGAIGGGLVQLASAVVTAIASLGVLFYLNRRLTVFIVIVLTSLGIAMLIVHRRLKAIFGEGAVVRAEIIGRLVEAFGGIKTVKIYEAEKREARAFTVGVHRLVRTSIRYLMTTAGISAASVAAVGAIGVVTIQMGSWSIQTGTMSVGDLVMYVLFTGLTAAPVFQLARVGAELMEAVAGLDRIRETLATETEKERDRGKSALPSVRGDIEFHNVCFAYTPGVPVLQDVTFRAPAGTTTALVGASGAGKTTLISLVLALQQPSSGRILVDGNDLETVSVHDYRKHVAAVLQQELLLDGTIAENVAYGSPWATERQIREASDWAHCTEFVESFERGFATEVGERGVRLSGGQRQRIAIARALLKSPKVLVLDEATSNLDRDNEELIQRALTRLRTGRTTLVIAHRLSTIRCADLILVLERGRIVDQGTHVELLARSSNYRALSETQNGPGVETLNCAS